MFNAGTVAGDYPLDGVSLGLNNILRLCGADQLGVNGGKESPEKFFV